MYGLGVYPPFPCPQELVLDIIRINHLRARGAGSAQTDDDREAQSTEAQSLLDRVEGFSPTQWAGTVWSGFEESWLLVARIYHAAVTLYCVSALQSIGLLSSSSARLNACRADNRDRLMVLLGAGLESRLLKKSLLWPLIVAGFEVACDGSEIERKYVAQRLEAQSRELGNSQPLMAKAALERFWSGGKTRWDECFDRPYAFHS
jgi:hypothetical protein